MSQWVLYVDEEYEIVSESLGALDPAAERRFARQACEALGLEYRPMTPKIKAHKLAERKLRNGNVRTITLGSLGQPFLLVYLNDKDCVAQPEGNPDLPSVQPVSKDTLEGLCALFRKRGAAKPATPAMK